MVTIEVIDTGQLIDVTDQKVTYVKQVAEIGDVTKLNSSYSWTMKFPKTPSNSEAFDDLGVIGSTSEFPYRKNYVNVYDNGIVIVRKGLLSVKETAEDYKAYVQEGIIDFIKALSNDKIGEVIDLSELDHVNDVQTIIDSFDNDTYRYIIANYNGMPLANEPDGVTNLSPTSLIPSINCGYLFDKIMDYYGWSYTGDLDINELWMTYPNATSYEDTGDKVLGLTSIDVRGMSIGEPNTSRQQAVPFTYKEFSGDAFIYVLGTQDVFYRCIKSGNYKISFNLNGTVWSRYKKRSYSYDWIIARILINDVPVAEGPFDGSLDVTSVEVPILAGETVRMVLFIEGWNNHSVMLEPAIIQEANISIYQQGVQDISFSSALIKYKVKDFFKEMMIRGALTSFTDIDNMNIDFVNLDNRIDAPVVDYSDKFIRRKKESYLYDSYAQNNYFKHKYDEDGDDYDDGNLIVDNDNLEIEKPLYEGNSYAPLRELVEYDGVNGSYFVNNFKMFEVEVKQDKDTLELLADYKPLQNRFYFMETETKVERLYILGVEVNSFPIAKINKVSYRDIVANKYSQINQLIERTKIHDIELALGSFDVATLDLKKVYYFSQESAYYLLNNLNYVTGEISTGEFILISRE